MEEIWDSNGPYALAKLADRMVSVPRDNEAQISLYALCRAWVRNNPSLPLLAETPPQQQPELKDAAARPGDAAGTIPTDEGLQAGVQPTQAPTQQHHESDQQQAQQQQQQTLPLDAHPNGLLSILPPVLPPTLLETETAPPNYPLDDFDAQEPEEALRKFKQHWTAVRQYHQALRAAKLSRHRERLVALLGEPSLLQPQVLQMQMQASGLVINPQQFLQQQQLQQMHQVGMLGLPTQVLLDQMPNGGLTNLSAFHGAGLVVGPGPGGGLPTGLQGGPMSGMVNFGVGPSATSFVAGGAGVSNVVDAQTALATIMNLGAADTGAVAQHQPAHLLQLQQQQQLGLVGGGLAGDPQLGLQPYDVAVALPHQQHNPQQSGVPQPSAAGITTGQQPVLGQLSAAVAAAAEAGQGKCQEHQLTAADTMTANAGNAVLPNIAAGQEAAMGSAGEQHALVLRSEGLKGMDIDSGSLHSS